MKLLDPALGAKARAVVRILTAVLALLASPAIVNFQFPWVASAVLAINAVLSFLTTFTDVGNEG